MGSSTTVAYTWRLDDALITAHTCHSCRSLFNHLYTLLKGNLVKIYSGGQAHIQKVVSVRKVRNLSPKLMNRIYNGGDDHWLVTCDIRSYHHGAYHAWTVVHVR